MTTQSNRLIETQPTSRPEPPLSVVDLEQATVTRTVAAGTGVETLAFFSGPPGSTPS